MEIIDSFCKDMTSNNINKIMRTNLNLNSNILAKNTTEILNTCINKLYKQVPKAYKMGLDQGKAIDTPRTTLKIQNRYSANKLATEAKSGIYESTTLKNLMGMNRKKPATKLPKKLLKCPGYKIYNSKRYCSSNSSCSASLWQRPANKSRLLRDYHRQANWDSGKTPVKQKSFRESLKSYSTFVQPRNQHGMCPSLATCRQSAEVSSHIQKDLMLVNEAIKNRLNVAALKAESSTKATKEKLALFNKETHMNLEVPLLNTNGIKLKPKKLLRETYMRMDSFRMDSPKKEYHITAPKKEPLIKSPFVKSLVTPSIKNHTSLSASQVNTSDLRDNEIKNNIKQRQIVASKKRRTTLRNCVPPEESISVKSYMYKNSKQYNGKTIAPSATYCLANHQYLANFKATKYAT